MSYQPQKSKNLCWQTHLEFNLKNLLVESPSKDLNVNHPLTPNTTLNMTLVDNKVANIK